MFVTNQADSPSLSESKRQGLENVEDNFQIQMLRNLSEGGGRHCFLLFPNVSIVSMVP